MQFFIVRKLDDADSTRVNDILGRILNITKAVGWEQVSVIEDAKIVIAIGGDGTMLYAMSISAPHEIPVVGFNIGKIGFLAEFWPNVVEESIIELVNGNWFLDERTMIHESRSKKLAINEFHITPKLSKDVLKYEFFIDGVSSGTHYANGLLISTPTGSTAYSLSVGGALLQPGAPVFQITPVAPMTMNSRAVIVSDDAQISVRIYMKQDVVYQLIADGQVILEDSSYDEGDDHSPPGHKRDTTFTFKKSVHKAVLMHSNKWNFFDVLKQKLHWNAAV